MPTGESPQHVFEGTPITASVKVVTGVPKSDSASFQFSRIDPDGKATKLDPIPAQKSTKGKGEYSARLETPEVGEAKADFYRLLVTCTLGEVPIRLGEEWVVWRERVEVVAKRTIDGTLTPAGNVTLRVIQGEQVKAHYIPTEGEYSFLVPSPGPFELNLEAPCELVKYLEGTEKGPKRTFEYKISPSTARIKSPASAGEGQSVKRFVNVPGEGNTVNLAIETGALSTGTPLGGQLVYFEAKFTNTTIRGKGKEPCTDADFLREATVDTHGGVQIDQRGTRTNETGVWKGQLTTDRGGQGVLRIHLGKGGGETCEIKLGTTKTSEDAQITFESWRRLFVRFWHTGSELTKDGWPEAQRQLTTDCFAKVNIELSYLPNGLLVPPGDVSLDPDSANTKPDWFAKDRSGWFTGDEVGLDPESVLVLNCGGGSMTSLSEAIIEQLHRDKKGLIMNVLMPDLVVDYHPFDGEAKIKTSHLLNPAQKEKCIATYNNAERLMLHKTGADVTTNPDVHFGKLPKKTPAITYYNAAYRVYQEDSKDKGAWIDLAQTDIVFEYDKKETLPPKPGEKDAKPTKVRGHVRILLPDSVKTRLETAARALEPLDRAEKENNDKIVKLMEPGNKLRKERQAVVAELSALEKQKETAQDKKPIEDQIAEKTKKKDDLQKLIDAKEIEIQPERDRINERRKQLTAERKPHLLTVDVRYDILLLNDSPPAGVSDGKTSIILVRSSILSWKSVNATVCHEIGHAIGMCSEADQLVPTGAFVNKLPGYATAKHPKVDLRFIVEDKAAKEPKPLHPRWYYARGHAGNHCADGASESNYSAWGDLSGVTNNMAWANCVIYGQMQMLATSVTYCENCDKLLKAMEVWTGKKARA